MRTAVYAIVMSLGLVGAAFAGAHEGTSKGVTVSHPWMRATPGGSTITAAFMEIKAEAADKLISAVSSVAGRVEVHTHIMDGNVMKMRRVDALDIKAGEARILKPMSDHIMLFDLKAPLKEGELVKLTLTFEKAGPIEVEATVEPVGANGPHGLGHQPSKNDEKTGEEHKHH